MPWRVAILRGQKVFARAKADGSLDAQGGRVEIRYKPSDGRAYQAGARNLEIDATSAILPDDHCVPGQAVASKADKKKSSGLDAHLAPVAKGSWLAYTDGACSGNPGPAGSGYVVVAPDGRMAEGWDFLGEATNNVAELTGIQSALTLIPKHAPTVIYTDSQYAIGVLGKGWKAKANQELIADIRAMLKGRAGLDFVYVRGHVGVPLNERADELARQAITQRRSHAPTLDPVGE